MVKKSKLPVRFVQELVAEVAGSDVVILVDLMVNKDYISEFKLAEKLELSVNQVRNMLYRLQNYNLVDFIRKKDKKKGWYIYYWLFDLRLASRLIKELKENKLVYLKKRLYHEKEQAYYKCPNDCIRLNEINAMEHGFKCDECGEILVREDIAKSAEFIKKEIKRLEEDLEELKKEFAIKAKEEQLKQAKEKLKQAKEKLKKRKVKKKPKKKIKKITKKKIKKKVKKSKTKKKPKKKTVSKKPKKRKLRKIIKRIKRIKR